MSDYKFDRLRETRRTWDKAEAEYGMMFSRDFKARIEEEACWDSEESDEANMGYLKSKIDWFMEMFSFLSPTMAAKAETPSAPIRGHYRKSFERRLYLLHFVVKAKGTIEDRADWPRIAETWNATNPSDIITPLTLKREYHIAKNDKKVIFNFHIERCHEIVRQLQQDIEVERKNRPEWEGKTWLEIADEARVEYRGTLSNHPEWDGKTWKEIARLEALEYMKLHIKDHPDWEGKTLDDIVRDHTDKGGNK